MFAYVVEMALHTLSAFAMGPHHAHQVHIALLPRLESKDSEIKLPTISQLVGCKGEIRIQASILHWLLLYIINLSQLPRARENYFLFSDGPA